MATTRDFIVKNGIQIQGVGSTTATNTGTGALIVNGGAGFNGDIYAKNMYSNGAQVITTASLDVFSGIVQTVTGGTDISVTTSTGDVTVNNISTLQSVSDRGATTTNAISITNATQSTGTQSGALTVTGGVGIGGNLNIAGNVNVSGTINATITGVISTATNLEGGATQQIPYQTAAGVTAFSSDFLYDYANQVLKVGTGGAEIGGSTGSAYVSAKDVTVTSLSDTRLVFSDSNHKLVDSANLTFNGTNLTLGGTGTVVAPNINPQNLTNTYIPIYNGSKLVDSGLTFNGSNQLGGYQAVFTSTVEATGIIDKNLTAGRVVYATTNGQLTDAGTFTFNGTTLTVPSLTSTGTVAVQGTGNSTTSTNGALTVAGGVGIVKDLTVGGAATIYGPTTFASPVTFNGTATFVLSTNTVYTDNILQLHVPPGGIDSTWTVNDGKDIGFRFHYYNKDTSSDAHAALVLDNDTQWLAWYKTGAESNTGTFHGAVYGGFETGQIYLAGTQNPSSATPVFGDASLQVAGGAAIAQDVWVGGDVYIDGSAALTTATIATYAVSSITTGSGISINTSTGAVTISNTGVLSVASGTDITVSAGTGNITINNASTLESVTGRGATTTNAISITNSTVGNSTSTGQALLVSGGIGALKVVASQVFDGGNRVLTSVTPIGGTAVSVTSVSTSNGNTTFTINNTGVTSATGGTDISVSASTGSITINNTSTLQSVSDRGSTTTNVVHIVNTSVSTSTLAGNALMVDGGIGANSIFANSIFAANQQVVTTSTLLQLIAAGDGISVTNNSGVVTVANTGVIAISSGTDISITGSNNRYTISDTSTLQSVTGRGATTTNAVSITNATASVSSATGALTVEGGIGTKADINAGGTIGFGPAGQFASYTSVSTNTAAVMNLDSYSATAYRTAKYIVQVVDDGEVQVAELLVFHDGTDAFIVRYGIGYSLTEMGDWDATLTGGTVTLQFTPSYNPLSLTVKTQRTLISA